MRYTNPAKHDGKRDARREKAIVKKAGKRKRRAALKDLDATEPKLGSAASKYLNETPAPLRDPDR